MGSVWSALQRPGDGSGEGSAWASDPVFAAACYAALDAHPSALPLWNAYFAAPSIPLLEAVAALAPRFPESLWVNVVLPLVARGLHAAQTVRDASQSMHNCPQ